ncbi:MAG: NAD(P)H-dependent oxidoreductase subunit E, partial [Geminicoccaceae bacterium]|nr:NAD(P)H-dependent oxidoreductase subunit E [Geminicoccaceae bacterium]
MNGRRRDGRAPEQPTGGRRRGHPKGRQVDQNALDEVRAVLGERPRRRDLLIELLHLIQERFGHLSARHLAALADEMRLAQTEVYEVATFYAHFDVVKEDETPPPPLTVRVCTSLTCAMSGAERLIADLAGRTDAGEARIVRAPCVGRCAHAPVAEVGHRYVDHATADQVANAVLGQAVEPDIPDYVGYDRYVADGGYRLLARYRGEAAATFQADEAILALLAELNQAGLRGLGGAGFPTGRKWEFVRQEPKPRYLAVNADEGEPGTFKDRYYLERDPHRFLEGMLIAAWSIEAAKVFIYLRDEYPAVRT